MIQRQAKSISADTRVPYTTVVRSRGHVEPAGVLRREVELQPAEEVMGLRRGEGLVESPGRVRGQVVHDHPDLVSVGEADVDEIAHLLGTVDGRAPPGDRDLAPRSEEHTSELQSLMRISYAVFCLKKKKINYMILL